TSRLFDHPVRFIFEVLLELVLIRASALLSSQFRSTFYGQRAGQLSIPDEKPGLSRVSTEAGTVQDADLRQSGGVPVSAHELP
ncbi:MAG: hypothetical protein ACXVHQ_41760, partial [Solirubrobacteraceae bacterium]